MAVASGTECQIVSATTTSGQAIACIQLASEGNTAGKIGWVPKAALRIGQARKVGNIGFNIGRPADPYFPSNAHYPSSAGGLTFKTVKNLLVSYCNNRKDLPVEPIFVRDRLNTEARQSGFADRIVKGIDKVSSQLRMKLDSGDFDWKQIRDYSKDASQLRKEVGIYLIVHEGFEDKNRQPEMYSGSTSENFQARNYKHRGSEGWGATAPTSPHYRAAKKAQKHYHFPICYFDSDDTEKSDLKIAEQIFQDLFQTTCTAILQLDSFNETYEDTDATAAAARREMRGAEAAARAAKYLEDKEAATVLARNAEKVFAATGWPGGIRRKSGKSFGIGAGLNWSMPITEMRFEKQTWIMTRVPGRVANYRRVAFISKEESKRNQGRKVIWQKNTVGKGDSNVAFYIPQNELGPANGAKVHVVVEVRLDNQSCGVSWSRQPTVGPWSDWFDATQVAMRIEWQDEHNKWLFKHLQSDYPNNFAKNSSKNDINGATTGYRVATGLKAYFLRQNRPQTQAFPWLYDFGIAEVKEIYFDHLSQTIGTRRISDKSNATPVRALSESQIASLLLRVGAEKYAHRADPNAAEQNKGDTGFPIAPGAVNISRWSDTTPGRPRVKCDYCSSMVKEGGRTSNQFPCTEVGSTRRCVACTSVGKPCTFTRDSILYNPNNTALLKATYNPKKDHTNVQPLQAARFVHSF